MRYIITLQGCDDSTTFELDVTKGQAIFLRRLAVIANKHRQVLCQPRIVLKEVSLDTEGARD